MVIHDKRGRSILTDMLETYLLAQYIMIDDLKDAVMDKMCRTVYFNSGNTSTLADADAVLAWTEGEQQLKAVVLDAVIVDMRRKSEPDRYDFCTQDLADGGLQNGIRSNEVAPL